MEIRKEPPQLPSGHSSVRPQALLHHEVGILVNKYFCFKGEWHGAKPVYGKIAAHIEGGDYYIMLYDERFVKTNCVLSNRETMMKYQWRFYDSLEEMRATLAIPTPEGKDSNENNG